jgi:hypothetical protein
MIPSATCGETLDHRLDDRCGSSAGARRCLTCHMPSVAAFYTVASALQAARRTSRSSRGHRALVRLRIEGHEVAAEHLRAVSIRLPRCRGCAAASAGQEQPQSTPFCNVFCHSEQQDMRSRTMVPGLCSRQTQHQTR